jgi:hypothetical protein
LTTREVPPVATWLLTQFVTGNLRESLLGDLFEEYQAGRTVGWYWRETLAALFVSMRISLRSNVGRLLSCRGMRPLLAPIAQALLLIWIVVLSEQYRQHCPTIPTLLRSSIVLMVCAGMVQIAIALLVWLGPLRRHVGGHPRSRLTRFSVTVFAAVGFSSGALTWAGTDSCAMGPPACSSPTVVSSCAHRADAGLGGRPSVEHEGRQECPSPCR